MTDYKAMFTHRNHFTLGVEEEYMLCDPQTGVLVNRATAIMEQLPAEETERFSYELIDSEIEINTPVSANVDEVMEHVARYRRKVRDMGEELGYRIGMSGTHPTSLAKDQRFVESEGYQWVAEQLHYYALRNITFATHVHVAMPDGEAAIAVTNAARRWLAPMLALSANSPFFQGYNTGMLSSRTFQFGAFPRTNIPDTFRSFDHFCHVMDTYMKMGSITKPRQIWWKIRPHGFYGTVEFRIADVQRSLSRTRMLVALSQAVCHKIVQELAQDRLQQHFEMEFLNDAVWKATRFGFDAQLADPDTHEVMTMADMVERLVDYVRPSLIALGSDDIIPTVEDVLREGNEAQEQLRVQQEGGFEALLQFLMDTVEFAVPTLTS